MFSNTNASFLPPTEASSEDFNNLRTVEDGLQGPQLPPRISHSGNTQQDQRQPLLREKSTNEHTHIGATAQDTALMING